MRKEIIVAATALGGLLTAYPAYQANALGYTFTDIDVPSSQAGSTGNYNGLAINNLGQIAGSYVDAAGHTDGFLYTGGKYFTVDAPGAADTLIYGINDWGQMVGTAYYENGTSNNFIDNRGKFTIISSAISPSAINNSDEVFGYAGNLKWGVLSVKRVISQIDLSGAPGAFPSGFNNLDQFTGVNCDSAGCHGFIDKKGAFTNFDYPNASYTSGNGINDWGQVVGNYFDNAGNGFGFLYTNGRFTAINDPNGSPATGGTWALEINDLDQIVGWYFDGQGGLHSFLGTPKLSFFASSAATSLDAVPEPSTWAMMLIGLIGLGCIGFRKNNSDPLKSPN